MKSSAGKLVPNCFYIIKNKSVLKIAQHGVKASIARVAFWTHEATSYVVRVNGKRLFLRVPNFERDIVSSVFSPMDTRSHAVRKYTLMKLFNTVFPKNSIKPVGITEVDYGGVKAFGVLSEIVPNRSKDYKNHHARVYQTNDEPNDAHARFVRTSEVTQQLSEIKKAGFSFEEHTWNIMNSNGRPVLAEVEYIDPEKLLAYLRKPTTPKQMRTTIFQQRIKRLLGVLHNTKLDSREKRRFILR